MRSVMGSSWLMRCLGFLGVPLVCVSAVGVGLSVSGCRCRAVGVWLSVSGCRCRVVGVGLSAGWVPGFGFGGHGRAWLAAPAASARRARLGAPLGQPEQR